MNDPVLSNVTFLESDYGNSPCWLWSNGHGSRGRPVSARRDGPSGRRELAYRTVWKHLIGPLSDDLHLHHSCENRRCVNPDHMEPLSEAEHLERHRKTSCPSGHPYTPETTYIARGKYKTCKICRRAIDARRRPLGKRLRDRGARDGS